MVHGACAEPGREGLRVLAWKGKRPRCGETGVVMSDSGGRSHLANESRGAKEEVAMEAVRYTADEPQCPGLKRKNKEKREKKKEEGLRDICDTCDTFHIFPNMLENFHAVSRRFVAR